MYSRYPFFFILNKVEPHYNKLENKHCSQTLWGVNKETLEIAIVACDERDDCMGIEDTDCDDDDFYLCKKGAIFKTSYRWSKPGSCSYRKSGNQ